MFKLLKYLRPYWWQCLILLAAIYAQVWGGLELPTLMSRIVNEGIVAGDQPFIWHTGGVMVIYTLISAVGALVASFLSARIGSALSRDLRNDIYKKVISFSISEMDHFSTASLITRTTGDIAQVQNTIIMCLSMLLRAPMMAIGAIIQAVEIAPDMIWIIVLAVVVLLILVSSILAIVVPKFTLYQKLIDKITLLTRENLTGLRVIRAFNNQKLEQEKFNRTNTKLMKTDIFIGKVMSLDSPLMTLVFNGTTLLCIWIGIKLMGTDISYLGNMMAFMQYAIQVVMSFLFLTVLIVMLPRANVSAKRINEVLHTRPKITWPAKTSGTPDEVPSVEFRHVDFAYPGAEEKVLRDISFKAAAGQTTAFIGSTGSGKSTIVNLIPRFHDATSGEVLVNGLSVKNYAEPDLMQKIGHVPQRAFLFSGNIKSNITFGNTAADDQTIQHAAAVAQASEFISKLEDQYQSHIAEGGTNVSGGQKQRLSIARAIAKNPAIYIFDDSFSALDMKTDKKLREALHKITGKSVTIIVAQRISTIKSAQQIIVLDAGKIVGRGTHTELLKSCKVYQEIAKSQLSEAEYKK
ncbi:ABC transporter ATP-binding protein, partial [Candidatus Saccharibacteria bacterium]|nr:ABC transporter ATP-binding protein [Candidatus Saccharibacteria bacterium]